MDPGILLLLLRLTVQRRKLLLSVRVLAWGGQTHNFEFKEKRLLDNTRVCPSGCQPRFLRSTVRRMK